MLQVEFVAVAAQPDALQRGDEETRTDPLTVVIVAVDGGHAPEVHVPHLKGLGPGHGQCAICGAEVVVNTGVDAHLSKSEVLVRGEFEHDVIAGGGLRPVERGLGVAREVVTGFVPHSETIGRCGKVHRSGWCAAAPLVRDGKRRCIAWIGGFCRVEKDAFVVGVGFEFTAHGDHQVERGFIATVKVILNCMVKIKREAVAGLVAVCQRHGGGAV